MGPVRKLDEPTAVGFTYGDMQGYVPVRSPEAFAYEDDINPETVRQLQAEADAFLGDGEWEVVDGFDGKW